MQIIEIIIIIFLQRSFVDATFCLSKLDRSLKKAARLSVVNRRPKMAEEHFSPWTEIVEACIEYKIKSLDTQDQVNILHNK
jgi:hypothetical protein